MRLWRLRWYKDQFNSRLSMNKYGEIGDLEDSKAAPEKVVCQPFAKKQPKYPKYPNFGYLQ